MRSDHTIVALFLVVVSCLVLSWREAKDPVFASILTRLQHECDPDNPEADYYWSQRSMPTERKREAIIQDCLKRGVSLLPAVRREIARETDEEIRGMLIVIAAALGDDDFVESAAREMTWSEYPAVRISAAKTLRRLKKKETINWFLIAMQDRHFVVNGGCGLLREQFFPVRVISQIALREIMAEQYRGDAELLMRSRIMNGGSRWETSFERDRYLEERLRESGLMPPQKAR